MAKGKEFLTVAQLRRLGERKPVPDRPLPNIEEEGKRGRHRRTDVEAAKRMIQAALAIAPSVQEIQIAIEAQDKQAIAHYLRSCPQPDREVLQRLADFFDPEAGADPEYRLDFVAIGRKRK